MVGAIQDATILAAGVGDLVNGLSPDWGPFAAVGTKARVIIQVLMAAVVLILFGMAIWGAWQIRVGNSQQNTMDVKQGKTMVISSLAGLFLIASMSTIFGIVFGMGV
jgi:heme/copper-type cytochrome/quinol oxidase subunit 2